MKRFLQALTCALILCAVFTAIGCSRTPPTDPSAQEIQACYDAMDQAIANKDVEAYSKFLAKELKVQPLKGLALDLDHFKEQISALGRTTVGKGESKTRIVECTAKDGQATVVVESKFKGEIEESTGKHQVESTTTTRDTWRKTDKGWQLVNIAMTASSSLRDGKPYTAGETKK